MLLSAILPYDVLKMTTKFMTDPFRILVKCDELTWEGIKRFFVAVEKEDWKFENATITIRLFFWLLSATILLFTLFRSLTTFSSSGLFDAQ